MYPVNAARHRMKDWQIIADNLKKAVVVWAGSQFWIVKGEWFGPLTRIAAQEAFRCPRR
jgi:hypothetical protein